MRARLITDADNTRRIGISPPPRLQPAELLRQRAGGVDKGADMV